MKCSIDSKAGKLALRIIWPVITLVMVSSVSASSGISSLYDMYSPEKQFPVKADCHVPNIAKNSADNTISGEQLEKRKTQARRQGYFRTEHTYEFPDVTLFTMEGEKTTLEQELVIDKPVMLNFIFTTCTTICPLLTASFYQLQNELGEESKDVKMISISIDPEYDTPEKLRSYAERFNAGSQWQFLTGDVKDIIAIEKTFGAYRGAKMNHEPLTYIRGKGADSWVRINGIASAEEIINEYRNLIIK